MAPTDMCHPRRLVNSPIQMGTSFVTTKTSQQQMKKSSTLDSSIQACTTTIQMMKTCLMSLEPVTVSLTTKCNLQMTALCHSLTSHPPFLLHPR